MSWRTSPPAVASRTGRGPPRERPDLPTTPGSHADLPRPRTPRRPVRRRGAASGVNHSRKRLRMLLAYSITLTEARSYIAALADHARTVRASSTYERALLELDRMHGDDVPALDTYGLTDERDILMAAATSAIEQLAVYDVDALQIELLLAALDDARALDEP